MMRIFQWTCYVEFLVDNLRHSHQIKINIYQMSKQLYYMYVQLVLC